VTGVGLLAYFLMNEPEQGLEAPEVAPDGEATAASEEQQVPSSGHVDPKGLENL
jgi:hypothetical protein